MDMLKEIVDSPPAFSNVYLTTVHECSTLSSEKIEFCSCSTSSASQKDKKNENKVVGQCCHPQTKFADGGNRTPYVSNWRLSARGRNIAHFTRFTRTRLPHDLKSAGKIQISQNLYRKTFETNDIAKMDSVKKLIESKKTNLVVKMKKRRWGCRSILTPTNTFGDDGTESLFGLHQTGFFR